MRIPKPWYREQTRGWYVKIDGVQHPLGKHPDGPPPVKERGEWRPPKAIQTAYHRLMAGEGLGKPQKDLPLAGLVEQFLADTAKTATADTCSWYRVFLDDFAGRYPKLKPSDVAPRHLRDWLTAERKRPWGQSTRRSAVTILKRLLSSTDADSWCRPGR